MLYVLSMALRRHKERAREIAAFELAQHWVWLAYQQVDVSDLPGLIPSASDDLIGLVAATAAILPHHSEFAQLLQARLSVGPP